MTQTWLLSHTKLKKTSSCHWWVFWFCSDTSTNPPESCIFGLMTFISACAGIAVSLLGNLVRQIWAFPRHQLKTAWLLMLPLSSKWKQNFKGLGVGWGVGGGLSPCSDLQTCRYSHDLRPVQVHGAAEPGYERGEATCEHGCSRTRFGFLFGDGHCCNLSGIWSLDLLHLSVMWRRRVWYRQCLSHFLLLGNSSDQGSWCRGLSLLRVWDHLPHPPDYHIVPGPSHRLLHQNLSGASGIHHHNHSGICPWYPSTQVTFALHIRTTP